MGQPGGSRKDSAGGGCSRIPDCTESVSYTHLDVYKRQAEAVRPLVDDEVDRLEVEVQQCMELTNTNRSRA